MTSESHRLLGKRRLSSLRLPRLGKDTALAALTIAALVLVIHVGGGGGARASAMTAVACALSALSGALVVRRASTRHLAAIRRAAVASGLRIARDFAGFAAEIRDLEAKQRELRLALDRTSNVATIRSIGLASASARGLKRAS